MYNVLCIALGNGSWLLYDMDDLIGKTNGKLNNSHHFRRCFWLLQASRNDPLTTHPDSLTSYPHNAIRPINSDYLAIPLSRWPTTHHPLPTSPIRISPHWFVVPALLLTTFSFESPSASFFLSDTLDNASAIRDFRIVDIIILLRLSFPSTLPRHHWQVSLWNLARQTRSTSRVELELSRVPNLPSIIGYEPNSPGIVFRDIYLRWIFPVPVLAPNTATATALSALTPCLHAHPHTASILSTPPHYPHQVSSVYASQLNNSPGPAERSILRRTLNTLHEQPSRPFDLSTTNWFKPNSTSLSQDTTEANQTRYPSLRHSIIPSSTDCHLANRSTLIFVQLHW
ncbi:hypothetical protein ACRALDRAFT_1094337 [Sodiomyces alcalophilus JCM 7366]|uniref:uncharacterized protein n=1 Tax=Sodiomyces alcalophilus JCM 7366 TaxID=591952 RepID=UPI0039B69D0E